MFNFLDRWIEKLIIRKLHKKRDKYIEGALSKFRKAHPEVNDEAIEVLRNNIIVESNRIYDTVDKSIITAGIKRAKWTFWIAVIASIAITITMIVLTHGVWLTLIVPVYASIIPWAVTIATLHIGYNLRVDGGLDAVIHAFEKSLEANEIKPKLDIKVADLAEQVDQIKMMLQDIEKILPKDKEPLSSTNEELNTSTKLLLLKLNNRIDKLDERVDHLYQLFEEEKKPKRKSSFFSRKLSKGESKSEYTRLSM